MLRGGNSEALQVASGFDQTGVSSALAPRGRQDGANNLGRLLARHAGDG